MNVTSTDSKQPGPRSPSKEEGAKTDIALENRYYRCPACGEMVDNNNREAVRLHHYHVIHRHPVILFPGLGSGGSH